MAKRKKISWTRSGYPELYIFRHNINHGHEVRLFITEKAALQYYKVNYNGKSKAVETVLGCDFYNGHKLVGSLYRSFAT